MDPGDNDNHQSPEWVVNMKNLLDGGLALDAKSPWIIGKVPYKWRCVRDTAFYSEMVFIGPLNRRLGQELQGLRHELKIRFLIRLLGGKLERRGRDGDVSRTTEGQRASDGCERDEHDEGGRMVKAMLLDDLAEAMQILEQKTRACYSESFDDLSSVEFVEMMVVDGCFVVELLRLYHQRFNPQSPGVATEYDPIFSNPLTLTALRRDLVQFENQLPFFILEKLYELINKKNKIDHQHAVPLEVLAVTFFDPLLPQHNAASKLDTNKPKAHLLDVFRSSFLNSEKVLKKGKSQIKSRLNPNGSIRGVVRHFTSELQEAGMQFKKWKGHDLLDIEFDHNTLRVPQLSINDNTISLLLNFVAYEMSIEHPEPFFTNYVMFWDSLVNSPRDIQIFRKHGIINHLGSEKEVVELFMRCREVIYDLDLGYLYNEIKEVNEYCEQYCESKYSFWWRSLIRERFSSPWTCLSLFAAIILLLLTLLETFYTVYAYYRPL
ncbi:UPF0481 protein At3g47200 isoform X1 [Eucalyptus grandis]|uniref:UPF0481 protein At3g47200 isoform X1 n=2 Tax=Eucalyptus grandis TaxID=71139 RepID=UPI00192EA7C1|nr:UPF0481 protein At3g47200 isoform X1 [Eucalyptus grandis]XP_010062796.2 UPF0481 protein At3g47200 isoform X1 [Eucalyptus grandis]XP_039170998.1 UPF0481 protein At3g47200 isoform X1 [Eucalyptus grandis]